MRKAIPYIVLLVGVLLFAWALVSLNARKNSDNMGNTGGSNSAPSSPSGSASSEGNSDPYTVKDQGEGSVEVSATYVTPAYLDAQGRNDIGKSLELEKNFAFAIAMNTHSVELADYKMDTISYLRDEEGREYPALPGWVSLNEGSGHHRSGIIRFAQTDSSSNLVLKPGAKSFELVIKGLAGVAERTFRWKLPVGSGG